MTNKLRILPLIVASVLLGAIVIQNAMASICFDCPDADVDVDVAKKILHQPVSEQINLQLVLIQLDEDQRRIQYNNQSFLTKLNE